jgi:hypothetical protein
VLLKLNGDSSSRAMLNNHSPFTIHHSHPLPSPLCAAHGRVEESGGIEDEQARALVFEHGAQGRRGPGLRRERVGGDADSSLGALDGERELLVAAQRDDERPRLFDARRLAAAFESGGVRLYWGGVLHGLRVDERGRVEHSAHAPAQGDDAEDCARGARQRSGPRAGLRRAVGLLGADGEELPARAQQQKLARLARRVRVSRPARLSVPAHPASGLTLPPHAFYLNTNAFLLNCLQTETGGGA